MAISTTVMLSESLEPFAFNSIFFCKKYESANFRFKMKKKIEFSYSAFPIFIRIEQCFPNFWTWRHLSDKKMRFASPKLYFLNFLNGLQ
jgi:hypothetical protein